MILVMSGLYTAMRRELLRVEAGATHRRPPATGADREPWTARIARVTNFVDADDAERHLDDVVGPALTKVADELQTRGVEATTDRGVAEPSEDDAHGGAYVELQAADAEHPFYYRVQVRLSPVPAYGGRMIGDRDRYARLDVHLADGNQGYDVMGYRESQVIHDCLDQYERHLEFLRLQETSTV